MKNFIVVRNIDTGKQMLVRTKYIRTVKETNTGCVIEVKYDNEAPRTYAVTDSFENVCGIIMLESE